MKKTMLLTLSLLLYAACGTQKEELTTSVLYVNEEEAEIQEVEEVPVVEDEAPLPEPIQKTEKVETKAVVKKTTVYQAPSLEEKIDAICSSKINNVEKDDCYFEQIKNEMIYYEDDIKNTIDDVRICDKIRGIAWQNAKCWQMFAVKNLNIDFCTAEDCRRNLKYEYQDAKWVATAASPTITTWPYEYSGTAKLRGWMEDIVVWGPDDSAPKYPHFRVLDADKIKLPLKFQNKYEYYDVNHNSPDILERLKQHSEQNPATITVNKVRAPWDGPPKMDIVEVH